MPNGMLLPLDVERFCTPLCDALCSVENILLVEFDDVVDDVMDVFILEFNALLLLPEDVSLLLEDLEDFSLESLEENDESLSLLELDILLTLLLCLPSLSL